jgi:hypothetical protein
MTPLGPGDQAPVETAKLLDHGKFRASRCIGFFLLHSLAYSNIYVKTNHSPQTTPFPLPHITRPNRPAFNNRKKQEEKARD